MARSVSFPSHPSAVADTRLASRSHSRQAYALLHWGFALLPVLAGLDKFTERMTDWDKYLSSTFARLSPFGAHRTMLAVGVVEILAGLLVAVKPKIGGLVVAAWLVGIIINLLLLGGYFDIVLRDFGLMLGALALSRIATSREEEEWADHRFAT